MSSIAVSKKYADAITPSVVKMPNIIPDAVSISNRAKLILERYRDAINSRTCTMTDVADCNIVTPLH
jgi:hypothetical protein